MAASFDRAELKAELTPLVDLYLAENPGVLQSYAKEATKSMAGEAAAIGVRSGVGTGASMATGVVAGAVLGTAVGPVGTVVGGAVGGVAGAAVGMAADTELGRQVTQDGVALVTDHTPEPVLDVAGEVAVEGTALWNSAKSMLPGGSEVEGDPGEEQPEDPEQNAVGTLGIGALSGASGAAAGAVVGTAVGGPVGTVVGMGVGAVAGTLVSQAAQETELGQTVTDGATDLVMGNEVVAGAADTASSGAQELWGVAESAYSGDEGSAEQEEGS